MNGATITIPSNKIKSTMIAAFRQSLRRPLTNTSLRCNSTLVIAEPTSSDTLAPATLSAITAASSLPGPISLLTFSPLSSVPSSVSNVLQVNADGNSKLAETVSNAVVAANEQGGYSHVVCAATKFGSNYLGRVGAMLGVSPVSDVVEVLSEGA